MQAPTPSSFAGCLVGGALGDALGYPIEFEKPGSALSARYGAKAPPQLCFADAARGLISDDTQMTLFTAEALIRARLAGDVDPTSQVLRAYQRWFSTQAMRAPGTVVHAPAGQGLLMAEAGLHARRAPGNTCLSAISASFMGRAMPTVTDPPNGSKGCGAVMRSAPFGLVAETREQAFLQARDAGVLTHGHPSGYLSGAYFASLVFDLAREVSLPSAMDGADALLAREPEAEEMQSILLRTRELAARGVPSASDIEALGGGWTGEEALAIALVVALTAGADVAEALWRAVLHGGDSDSTGSLVGNLLGAMHGAAALPSAWVEELELVDLIERVADDLWVICVGGRARHEADYPTS